jgi:hypothetical protein
MTNNQTLEGILHLFSETGTEGGFWAFQDSNYISQDNKSWSYDGLHILKDGDQLTIYNPQNNQEIWSGNIDLIPYKPFKETAGQFWIHADQKNIERETWAEYFFKEYKAKLIKKN